MHTRRPLRALLLAGACGLAAASAMADAAQPVAGVAAKAPRGYTVVTSPVFGTTPSSRTPGQVTCPTGLVPLGGGVVIQSTRTDVNVNSSFPTQNGWSAQVTNASPFPFSFVVLAVCALQPNHYAIVAGPATPNNAGTQVSAFATCPAGSMPLGGGAASGSPSVFANMHATAPDGTSWEATMNNGSAPDTTVTAFAVCGTLPGYTVVGGSDGSDPQGTETPFFASCPAGKVPISGGAVTTSQDIGVNAGSMLPIGSGFQFSMNNEVGNTAIVEAVAVCAGR
jgi:hypothetical protein